MNRGLWPSRNKYHAKRTEVDGHWFDSDREAKRYGELKLLVRAGIISNLELQKSYTLEVHGVLIATYKADFVYKDLEGRQVVEDVKSPATRTRDYILKAKLMLACHNIRIVEV